MQSLKKIHAWAQMQVLLFKELSMAWCLLVTLDDSQLGFVPEIGTTDACDLANAGEMPSSEQAYLYDLPGPREGI